MLSEMSHQRRENLTYSKLVGENFMVIGMRLLEILYLTFENRKIRQNQFPGKVCSQIQARIPSTINPPP